MACKVEKFESVGKGNGLRTTSPASPGDVLYVAEPFAYTIRNAEFGKICEFCLTTGQDLLQCSRCKVAKYCGKQCQAEAWPDHKGECKCLKRAKSNIDTYPIRLVGKVVFKILQKRPCTSEQLLSLHELDSNLEKLSNKVKEELELFAEMLRVYMKEEIPVDINLVELFAKEITNRFSICEGTKEAAAVGLYPSMSLLNHSCEPNCIAHFKGRHFHLRAIRSIQAGEELTISYVYPLMPTEERQSELRRKYYFECDCNRCQTRDKDDMMLAGDKQASDETKELAKIVQKLQSKDQWEASLALCRAQIESNTGRVPDENIYQLAILDHAMTACVHLKLQDESLHYGTRTLEPYRLYCTGISGLMSEEMFKVGLVLLSHGRVDEAISIFQKVYEVVNIFYGEDNYITQTVKMLLARHQA